MKKEIQRLPDTLENRVNVGEELLAAASPDTIEPLPDTFENRMKVAEQLLASAQQKIEEEQKGKK